MGYHVVRAGDHAWEERTPPNGRENDPRRHSADVTTAASLQRPGAVARFERQ